MSKSQEILERGRQERATFTPEPDSAPTKAYWYWVNKRRGGVPPRNENFCHFWRVILIWAPLALVMTPVGYVMKKVPVLFKPLVWAGRKIGKFFSNEKVANIAMITGLSIGVLITVFSLIMAFISDPMGTLMVFGMIALIAAIITGIIWAAGKASERKRIREAAIRAKRNEELDRAILLFIKGEGPDPFAIEPVQTKVMPRKVGWIEKVAVKVGDFLTAVGEFCLVAINAVRVNKWKICPLVEVPLDKSKNA